MRQIPPAPSTPIILPASNNHHHIYMSSAVGSKRGEWIFLFIVITYITLTHSLWCRQYKKWYKIIKFLWSCPFPTLVPRNLRNRFITASWWCLLKNVSQWEELTCSVVSKCGGKNGKLYQLITIRFQLNNHVLLTRTFFYSHKLNLSVFPSIIQMTLSLSWHLLFLILLCTSSHHETRTTE